MIPYDVCYMCNDIGLDKSSIGEDKLSHFLEGLHDDVQEKKNKT